MAKDNKPAENGDEAAPKKSKKLLIIILAVVLLLVVGGGAAAFLLMKGSHDEEHADDDEVAEEPAKPAKKKDKKKEHGAPPVFVNLDPFTVNLVPETGDQYLQVALSLELEGPESQAELTAMMPKIRNNVVMLLSAKKASELLTKEGKEKLAGEIREQMNHVLAPGAKEDDAPVKEVLFTSFIIQ